MTLGTAFPHKRARPRTRFGAAGYQRHFDDPVRRHSRGRFDVRFYLVAISFIIFDLEASFLFPWAVSLEYTGWTGWGAMMVFLAILGLGLAYEWKKGALDWE